MKQVMTIGTINITIGQYLHKGLSAHHDEPRQFEIFLIQITVVKLQLVRVGLILTALAAAVSKIVKDKLPIAVMEISWIFT